LYVIYKFLHMEIKTNILYLEQCQKTPCKKYLSLFQKDEEGKLFVFIDKVFAKFGHQYHWLYKNTNVDFVAWEIQQNKFDWKKNSWVIPMYCPQNFNEDKYNWEDYSNTIAIYAPELLNANKFNWINYSWVVAIYCPDKIDVEKFNWEACINVVKQYCPQYLNYCPQNLR